MAQVAEHCTHIYSYTENTDTVTFKCILCESTQDVKTSEAAAFKQSHFIMIRKELGA